MMEFHISRKARERYRFAESLFSYNGNVVFAGLAACREFAHRMNQVRQADKNPDQAVHAGQLYAMGLIDEASHVLMARYREQFDPEVMPSAIDWFGGRVGTDELDKLLLTFVEFFPGQSVMRMTLWPGKYSTKVRRSLSSSSVPTRPPNQSMAEGITSGSNCSRYRAISTWLASSMRPMA